MSKTIGERRVRTEFNPSADGRVDEIKQKSAELINLCEDIKNYDSKGHENEEIRGEEARLVALAQTKYEEAAMYAVKAATI